MLIGSHTACHAELHELCRTASSDVGKIGQHEGKLMSTPQPEQHCMQQNSWRETSAPQHNSRNKSGANRDCDDTSLHLTLQIGLQACQKNIRHKISLHKQRMGTHMLLAPGNHSQHSTAQHTARLPIFKLQQ